MTLAVEDKNQKLFDVLAFAVVDNEQIVDEVLVTASFGNSLTTAFQCLPTVCNIFVKAQDQLFVACLYLVEVLSL